MSEELIQRRFTRNGIPFGPYQFYNIGSTTIKALRTYKIIPNKEYAGHLTKKPDALLVDKRNKSKPHVIVVIENKTPEELNTAEKKTKAIEQCILDYCKPLSALCGVVTDGQEYIWINPQLNGDQYEIISREDGYPLHLPFSWGNQKEIDQTLILLEKILSSISQQNSQIKKENMLNPSDLADRVWQTIWLSSGENPDQCLSTFVEIFVFKYLSDLNVLDTNESGVKINFKDNLLIEQEKSLIFYFKHVRPHIKKIFPPNITDGTSIINGIILNPEISEHNYIFNKILVEFQKFGSLVNIDPEFKSRLYENFLKKSISQKNWGQYFTPRNIIKAMIEMSDIEHLEDNAKVHDPACGVGGFILEPILTKRSRDYYFDNNDRLKSKLQYTGYDRDPKTIILAKANMLIHLNELMKFNPRTPIEFSNTFNSTFGSYHTSILGSLSLTQNEEYDLIMTNPPFVSEGTPIIKEFIKTNSELKNYYLINGQGIESLFVENIIRSLKKERKALIIVPDGLMNRLNDKKVRDFISRECIIDAIISLPINAFYTTPKKTYILALTKKADNSEIQTDPIFTYLIINTGETLDSKRFECANDLPMMARLFKYFKSDKLNFENPSSQCKVVSFEKFKAYGHWSVDRWWTEEEKIALGILDEKELTSIADFTQLLVKEKEEIQSNIKQLKAMENSIPQPKCTVEIYLDNKQFFNLFIGKRVLKKELYNKTTGKIPLFSANVYEPFGFVEKSNIKNFKHDNVIWGIDGDFNFNVIKRNHQFSTTDHCGCIQIIDDNIDPDYLNYYLTWIRANERLDRSLRANLQNMKRIKIKFPVWVDEHGEPQRKEPNIHINGVDSIFKWLFSRFRIENS